MERLRESQTIEYACKGETVKPAGGGKSAGGAVGCIQTG